MRFNVGFIRVGGSWCCEGIGFLLTFCTLGGAVCSGDLVCITLSGNVMGVITLGDGCSVICAGCGNSVALFNIYATCRYALVMGVTYCNVGLAVCGRFKIVTKSVAACRKELSMLTLGKIFFVETIQLYPHPARGMLA